MRTDFCNPPLAERTEQQTKDLHFSPFIPSFPFLAGPPSLFVPFSKPEASITGVGGDGGESPGSKAALFQRGDEMLCTGVNAGEGGRASERVSERASSRERERKKEREREEGGVN